MLPLAGGRAPILALTAVNPSPGRLTAYFLDQGLINPAYKLGRVIRMKKKDVEAFLEANRIEPGSLRHRYPPGVDEQDDGDGT